MAGVFHRATRTPRTRQTECAAIFVHAGAGYHSVQNEMVHLEACNDAAKAAMAILRAGGKAVDAVEMAIKVLEDKEITNAGYGSNLAIDGVVEGDAVIVDHFGRSGGVGAVAQIKNPISLARLVFELSTQELTLRRVPPNLLVGQGATDFAFDQGMPVLPHDALVSPSAGERWNRWRQDLKHAERKARRERESSAPAAVHLDPPPHYEEHPHVHIKQTQATAIRTGVWNEGQPASPPPSDLGSQQISGPSTPSRPSSTASGQTPVTPHTPSDTGDTVAGSAMALTAENLARTDRSAEPAISPVAKAFGRATNMYHKRLAVDVPDFRSNNDGSDLSNPGDVDDGQDLPPGDEDAQFLSQAEHDGRSLSPEDNSSTSTVRWPSLTPSPESPASPAGSMAALDLPLPRSPSPPAHAETHSSTPLSHVREPSQLPPHPIVAVHHTSTLPERRSSPGPQAAETLHAGCSPSPSASFEEPASREKGREDTITDTVGAIAIDNEGNIACGASSGGIGMKFRGRIGPAALVGVGAAVVPADSEDRSKLTTAVVTSGTGEHMGTTLAAQVCADRLYNGVKKRKGGSLEHCEDDQAVRGMIEQDFMEHPSVKNSHSTGAIGVLAVKKTAHGIYLYFAHNTDSFALASMQSDESKPTSTMSRSLGNGTVATGGRAMRYKRKA